jgi:hypothetical protein
MHTIIAGSRDITNPAAGIPHIEAAPWEPSLVLCGMARGVDLIGRAWALSQGIEVREYPAAWRQYGRRAGPMRNQEMVDTAQALVVIRFQRSRGSKDVLMRARLRGLVIHDVVLLEPPDLL